MVRVPSFPPRFSLSPRVFLKGCALAALAVLYLNSPPVSLGACVAAVFLGAYGAACYTVSSGQKRNETLLVLGIAIGLLVGGLQSGVLFLESGRSFSGIPLQSVASFRATLTTDSVLSDKGMRIYTCALTSVAGTDGQTRARAQGSVTVVCENGPELYSGESLEVRAKLSESGRQGGTRFIAFADGKKISSAGFSNPFFARRKDVILALRDRISLLGAPASSLFEAFVLGVREDLSPELRDSFEKTGSLHLLALSGLHVGIIAALLFFFLSPFRHKRLKIVIVMIFVLFYLFLAGPKPSLLRAVLMLLLAGIGILLDRETHPLSILAASAVMVILIDPGSVHSLSFKLSYLALLGIFSFGKRLDRLLIPVLPRFLRGLLAAAVSAWLFTAPLVLENFGAVYPVGMIASLLLIPLATAFIWTGIILFPVTFLSGGPALEAVRAVLGAGYQLLFQASSFFSRLPGIRLPWQDWYWIPAGAMLLALAVGNPVKYLHALRFAFTDPQAAQRT